jgi:hypothetical protein
VLNLLNKHDVSCTIQAFKLTIKHPTTLARRVFFNGSAWNCFGMIPSLWLSDVLLCAKMFFQI